MKKTIAYELFGKEWADLLYDELKSGSFINLTEKLALDRLNNLIICPKKEDIFKAFRLTNLTEIKVVLIGQDPYHTIRYDNSHVATGLSFGINHIGYITPSLKNIIKELESDLKQNIIDFDYTLESWAIQGVLMLNTALTVLESNPNSHAKYWISFTEKVLEVINKYTNNTVFILWGNQAQSYKKYLTNPSFKFIESSHPSPFSCNQSFFGSKPFSKTNSYLNKPINWTSYI